MARTYVVWGQVPAKIHPAEAPNGEVGVLLQFAGEWLLVGPQEARELAARLLACADEVDEFPLALGDFVHH